MPMLCIQCALREFVKTLEAGRDPMLEERMNTSFDENPREHMLRLHPDPEATARERHDLELRARVGFERLKAANRARAEASGNN